MTASPELTSALQQQLAALEDDLRARVEAQPQVKAQWQAEHREALTRERTAASWQAWRDERVMQAAAAWVLTTVFVRFCEDNGLVTPVWIAGPESRRQEALDAQLAYFRQHPEHTDREWLRQAVDYLATLPATAALVDEHCPLHLVSPSGDAARALLAFWRERDEAGALVHDLTDPSLTTRFLGDLYQDLSAFARDTYALLQTPVFVEEFILDRTLEPALAERPLEGFRLIDPACGSGHFLLGAFARLLDRWDKHAPGLETQARVQTALDAIHGVDVNPFSIAIARFRLTVAALRACGSKGLEEAPAFTFHLAVGDSLLHGSAQQAFDLGPELDLDSVLSGHTYSTEDLRTLRDILQPGRYDVVVGNPPYITVRDKNLNKAYRERYKTCKGTYAMTVPFMERFFDLAKGRDGDQPTGWVGQITSNSFMKREFGARLIEELLSRKDLRLVADTSGAYIPGHGTPTVIVVGRDQSPVGSTVRAVLGIRGEPGRPAYAAKGIVWRSIVDHVDDPGHDDGWTSTANLDRSYLARHPWSLAGGGAVDLVRVLGAAPKSVSSVCDSGFRAITGLDDVFVQPIHVLRRIDAPTKPYVTGEGVRDYSLVFELIIFPYDKGVATLPRPVVQFLWPWRAPLQQRKRFGVPIADRAGTEWWELREFYPKRFDGRPVLVFSFVATHNHFSVDRVDVVANRHAPVVQMLTASDADHLALLGVLNSSTACFWLKQNSHNKGEGGGARVDAGYAARGEPWRETYEFTGTTLQDFPLPAELPLQRGQVLDQLAQKLGQHEPHDVCEAGLPTREALDAARTEYEQTRGRMILEQEELDWEVYRRYGLINENLTYEGADLTGLTRGQRAFEIALARQLAAGEADTTWFTHPAPGFTPITAIPEHWPAAYRDLVQRRLDLIAGDKSIRLLEKPEHKRRWSSEPWAKREQAALRDWLLDRLEHKRFWFDGTGRPTPRSVAQLADEVARDKDLSSVLTLWAGRPDAPVTATLVELLSDQAVPFLAGYRYKPSGLRKREAWEHTWEKQRAEDRGEKLTEPIPVPPKYTSADFTRTSYWQHRGKLDVPKERFIGYPDAGRDTDPTPLLGWAGWDHAQQALALNTIIQDRETDGWSEDKLEPLVAGLAEVQPWIDQWHTEVDATYGVNLAAFCRELLTEHAARVGRTLDELKAWRPEPARHGRR